MWLLDNFLPYLKYTHYNCLLLLQESRLIELGYLNLQAFAQFNNTYWNNSSGILSINEFMKTTHIIKVSYNWHLTLEHKKYSTLSRNRNYRTESNFCKRTGSVFPVGVQKH